MQDQQVLALHAPYGNTIAAAYFEPESNKMYVMEDTKDTLGWDLACLGQHSHSVNGGFRRLGY